MQLQTGIFSEVLSAENQRIAASAVERRSSLENPQTPLSYPAEWLLDAFNGGRTDAGVRVSEMTALQVVTVLACIDLIGGSLASLPWAPYERTFLKKSGRAVHTIAYGHDYYDLLSCEPNDEMTQFVMFKAQAIHFLLWGNSYVEIQRDGANSAIALWPRNPNKTRPYRLTKATRMDPVAWRPFPVNLPAGALVYKTTDGIEELDESEAGANGYRNERIIAAADMLHIPGLSLDGRLGQNIVQLARQTIGLALATEKYGAKYFANYARPGGILEVPFPQGSEQWKQAKASWREAQGGENANSVAAMPAGFKWTATSDKPEDAQSVETQQMITTRICSLFHVPPHKVGQIDKGRANTEQLAQEYATDTLGQWIVAIKQEYKRKLFPNTGVGRTPRNRFYVDCDLWKIVRPDAASREAFYGTARNIGGISANDFREFEGMNPIEQDWAEDFWMPINMTLVTTPVDPTHQDGAGNGDQPDEEDDDQQNNKGDNKGTKKQGKKGQGADEKNSRQYVDLYFRMFRDSFGRILSRDKADLRAFASAFGPVLWSLADLFAGEKRGKHSQETDKFLAEYLAAMQKRRAEWIDSDDVARAELVRAVKAVRIAVYRDVATQQALAEEEAAAKEKQEQLDEA